jgi:hypothetical protein
LVNRLETLRNITQQALEKNSEHLASHSSQIVQMTEGVEVMKGDVLQRLKSALGGEKSDSK